MIQNQTYTLGQGLGSIIFSNTPHYKPEERFQLFTSLLLSDQCYVLRYMLNQIEIGNAPKHEFTDRFSLLLQDKISQNKDFEIYSCAPSRIKKIYTMEQFWDNLEKGLSFVLEAQNQDDQKEKFRNIKRQILACPSPVLEEVYDKFLSQEKSVDENPIISDMKKVLEKEVKNALEKPFYRDDYLPENIVSNNIKSFRESYYTFCYNVQNANLGLNKIKQL